MARRGGARGGMTAEQRGDPARAPVQVHQRALLSWAAGFADELPRKQQAPAEQQRPSSSSEDDPAGMGRKGTESRRCAEERVAKANDARRRRERLAVKQNLKDGTVVLRILMDIFPTVAEAMGNHLQQNPTNRYAVNHNWKCIETCLVQLGLPLSTVDRAGLSVARDKATNTILATLFFLHQLKHRPNFTAAFTFRLGEPIEDYLQSGRCLTSLARSGAIPSAGHLRQPIVFDVEVPTELTDPQWLWRNGAGNSRAIRQSIRRDRKQQTRCAAVPESRAVRRGSTQQTAVPSEKPCGTVPLHDNASSAAHTVPASLVQYHADGDTQRDSAPQLLAGKAQLTEEQEELLYLRKLRKVHTKQIKAMTESNNTLQQMVQKLEATIDHAADSASRSTKGRGTDEAELEAQTSEHTEPRQLPDPQQRLFQRQVDEARAVARHSAEKLKESETARQVLIDEKIELEAQLMRLAEAQSKLENTHSDTVVELDCTTRELSDCRETCEMLELELRERTETLDELLRQQPQPQLKSDPRMNADAPAPDSVEDEAPWADKHDTDYAYDTQRDVDDGFEQDVGALRFHSQQAIGLHEESRSASARTSGNQARQRRASVPSSSPNSETNDATGAGALRSAYGQRRRAVRFQSECVVCDDGGQEVVRIALQRPPKSLKVLRLEERQGRYLSRHRKPWQSVFRGSTRRQTRYAR